MQTQATPQLEIERHVVADQHQLRGVVSAATGVYQYRLNLIRQGPYNQALSSQAGEVRLRGDQRAYTGQIRISIRPGDHYSVHLQLLDTDDELIVERWLEYP